MSKWTKKERAAISKRMKRYWSPAARRARHRNAVPLIALSALPETNGNLKAKLREMVRAEVHAALTEALS